MKRLSLVACIVLPVLAMGSSAVNAGEAPPPLSFPEGVALGINSDGGDRSKDLATLKKRLEAMDRFVYVVRMSDDPVIAYDGNIPGFKATRPKKGKKVNPNSALVRKYQKFLERKHDKALAAIGATEKKIYGYTIALNGFSALMTAEDAKALAKQPGVLSVKRDELRQPLTDNSPAFLGLTDPGGAYEKGFSGEGVVVGIIDTGICDPDATEPSNWHQFLKSVWPDDPGLIGTLQEVFGYLLASDTSQQKIFMMVGPKRSGKGTIARVLTALLGQGNVSAPTLASMSTNFGLWPLIGKSLAVISDARLSGHPNHTLLA